MAKPTMWIKMKHGPMYVHELRGVCYISWVLEQDKGNALTFPTIDVDTWISILESMSGEKVIAVPVS